jgi:hypothetical protein
MTGTEVMERGGCAIRRNGTLAQLVQRRPAGVTGHQWSEAGRARLDFVVCDADTGAPSFALIFAPLEEAAAHTGRQARMIDAVCGAVGLGTLRIGSSTLRADTHGRRIVEYVMDARAFAAATADLDAALDGLDPGVGPYAEAPPPFREIVGTLPDGRRGFVNDLGALARAAAIEAYASRQLADPLLRGLRVQWRNGPAEGWGWLDLPGGRCLFERVLVDQRRFSCGVEPHRLAEDLAALAVGDRLRSLDTTDPTPYDKHTLRRELELLRQRRGELDDPRATDHIAL